MYRGTRRTLGDAVKQAKPLLPAQLEMIFNVLLNTPGHTAFRAAVLISFRELLRKAHVTVSSATLRRKDVTFHPWGMLVHVNKSKTIQFCERTVEIPISSSPYKPLCAVHWVKCHFLELEAEPQDAAFRLPSPGGGSVPMKYSVYEDTLKYVCEEAGLQKRDYSSHSLRRGGATFLHMVGASVSEIKERGDWSSDCVYEYLKTPLVTRVQDDMRVSAMLTNWMI